MPKWVSQEGVWHPRNEKVALVNNSEKVKKIGDQEVGPGEPYIYEGPDRAALFQLFQEKQESLGGDFRHDAEFLLRVKNLGYRDLDDYLSSIGYDSEKAVKLTEEKLSRVNKHELPKKIKAIETLGGGKDFSGQGNDKAGGFGEHK